jgi:glutamate formiminotransferase
MRVLTVPNWSFGRNRDLENAFRSCLDDAPVVTHYCQGDVDHNRTVTAFSGDWPDVRATLESLCEIALPAIDLNRHIGVHPRIGALDVCPFVAWEDGDSAEVLAAVEVFASDLSERWSLPVYLYEKSERGRHEADLPALRKDGFGTLGVRTLSPDFGPTKSHPRLGVSVVGVRSFLVAMNANLDSEDLALARRISKAIRSGRSDGDERFLGIRSLGLPLASKEQVQVSMNLTLPDLTAIDPILEWIHAEALKSGSKIARAELVGVIRHSDLAHGSRLPHNSKQVVW